MFEAEPEEDDEQRKDENDGDGFDVLDSLRFAAFFFAASIGVPEEPNDGSDEDGWATSRFDDFGNRVDNLTKVGKSLRGCECDADDA